MPNYVPMEMQVGPVGSRWGEEKLTALQVLSGILPISQVSSLPSCIQHATRLMPLEEVFRLVNPSIYEPPVEDKRTWREGFRGRRAIAQKHSQQLCENNDELTKRIAEGDSSPAVDII